METEKKVKTILVFCAEEQKETEHTLDIAGNGEIVLTCKGHPDNTRILTTKNPDGTETESKEIIPCGRFLKFPKGTTAEELKTLLAKHEASNEGQLSQAKLDAEKEKLLGDLLG